MPKAPVTFLTIPFEFGVQGRNYCYIYSPFTYECMLNYMVLLEFSPVKLLFIRRGRLLRMVMAKRAHFLTTLLAF